jgi:hypothetical protein
MRLTRSIVGALAAGGLVLGMASAASAGEGCDDDWDDWDDDDIEQEQYVEAHHVGKVHASQHVNVDDDDTEWSGVIINAFD